MSGGGMTVETFLRHFRAPFSPEPLPTEPSVTDGAVNRAIYQRADQASGC